MPSTPFRSSPRFTRCLALAAAAFALAVAGAAAQAQAPMDPQFQALADVHRYAELAQAAAARVATRPDDGDAWLAYTRGVLGETGADASAHRDAAIARLSACARQTPRIAACHYGVGAVTGMQVLSQGLVKAAFGIGQVRDEFIRTLEIDQTFYPARSGLVQFYLMAPGLMGGSVSEAREVAQETTLRQPEHAKLLNAMILEYDDKPGEAERQLADVQVGEDADLARALRERWVVLGFGYLEGAQPAKAQAVFERVAHDKPDLAEVRYGLGRALADQRQWDAAVAEFRAAAALPGHDVLPIDYRLGVAWQGKGDVAQARAAFLRYLTSANPDPQDRDDARKRLTDLG